jgi:hypothetical protein
MCAALLLAALPAAEAATRRGVSVDGGGVPTIDLNARCKKAERTLIEMLGNSAVQAFDACMSSEQAAKKALDDAWKDMPATIRYYCIRPNDYSPSYVEWIACVEMIIDLRKQRAQNDTKYVGTGRCPVISYADDGSIKRINACPL